MKKEKDTKDKIFTIPNVITMARLSLAIPFFGIIATNGVTAPYLCASIISLLAATDAVDGYIARKFHMQSHFGEVLDPIADKIFNWGLCFSLIACGAMPLWPLLILIRDVSVATVTFYQYRKNKIRMLPTFPAKLKTTFQSIGVISTILFGFGLDNILSMIAPLMMIGAISTNFFEVGEIKKKYFSNQKEKDITETVKKTSIPVEEEKNNTLEQVYTNLATKENDLGRTLPNQNIEHPLIKQKSIFQKYD